MSEKVLKINARFRIRQDQYSCWLETLVAGKNKKTGAEQESWRRVTGYMPDFTALFRDYAKTEHRNIEAKSVEEALRKMAAAEAATIELIQEALQAELERKRGKG